MLLGDRTALITGAGSGIGRAIALAFAREGARVAIVDVDPDSARRAAEAIASVGGQSLPLQADVSLRAAVNAAVKSAAAAFGGLDILVNNAGICPLEPLEQISLESWDRVLAVNLTGAFLCVQATLPHLKRSRCGRIINIGSVAGRIGGLAVGAHYSVSKAGLMCLTKVLAKTLAGERITANTISPGTTETALTADWSETSKAGLRNQIPLGRLGTPEDVAAAAVFLASDGAAYVTGATIDVNGGLVMF